MTTCGHAEMREILGFPEEVLFFDVEMSCEHAERGSGGGATGREEVGEIWEGSVKMDGIQNLIHCLLFPQAPELRPADWGTSKVDLETSSVYLAMRAMEWAVVTCTD
mmetsp:Transcript_28590/g.68184  ORF Transcript_28590/g.68184 Transcript_28590/m.68184 type:complete len:107 (+) Transcript_28590:1319-1639(+)